jgi:hypothetical protein
MTTTKRRLPRKALANVLDWADRGVSWQCDQDNRYRSEKADKADIAKVRAFFGIPDPETQRSKKKRRKKETAAERKWRLSPGIGEIGD